MSSLHNSLSSIGAAHVNAPVFVPRERADLAGQQSFVQSHEQKSFTHGSSSSNTGISNFFVSPPLRNVLQQRVEASTPKAFPDLYAVHDYRGLTRLECHSDRFTDSTGVPYASSAYRATHIADGTPYYLLRIGGLKIAGHSSIDTAQRWKAMRHPSVVTLHEAFTTRAFSDHSVILVYDFHPSSRSLHGLYGAPPEQKSIQHVLTPSELQSFIVQLALGLRAIHSAGLAARAMSPTNVIVTGPGRVRIAYCGVQDIFENKSVFGDMNFQSDIVALGQLIFWLSNHVTSYLAATTDGVGHMHILPKVRDAINYLISPANSPKSLDHFLIAHCQPWMADELTHTLNHVDCLETHLTQELQNGRLFKLLTKLGFINERPEFQHDPRWSETGDRYILKLFRDYVFHRIDEEGHPIIDLSHVLMCLNKLDVGSDERLMMTSEDEETCIIVTYREIKTCVNHVYAELETKNRVL